MSGSRRLRQKVVPGKVRAVASYSLLCLSEETPLLPQAPCQAPAWEVLIPKTYILNTAGGSEYRLLLPISSLSQGCHLPGLLCVWPPWPWMATPSPPTHAYSLSPPSGEQSCGLPHTPPLCSLRLSLELSPDVPSSRRSP